jgi:limonene-1,2-epoxide hydrolase
MKMDYAFTVKVDTITVQASTIEELTEKLKKATEGKEIASIAAVVGAYEITNP